MSKIVPLLFVFVLLCGCGGQTKQGSPNSPNEQQGNAAAQPEKDVPAQGNAQRGDNQAGRNAHGGKANAGDNK